MNRSLVAPIFGVFTVLPFLFLAVYSTYTGEILIDASVVKDIGYYSLNSAYLLFFGCLGALLLGLSTAFLAARYEFCGSSVFSVLFILPLALPSYLSGYAYVWIFQKGGLLSTVTGNDGLHLDILNLYGASFVFATTLFTYVYLLARSAFSSIGSDVTDLIKIRGASFFYAFFRVYLPLSLPSAFVGLSLVAMEILSDYGTVTYFGVSPFSVGIFKTWFGYGDLAGAVLLSGAMMVFVFAVFAAEMRYKNKISHTLSSATGKKSAKVRLTGLKGVFAFLFSCLVVAVSFFIPVCCIAYWLYMAPPIDLEVLSVGAKTVVLSVASCIVIVFLAYFVSYFRKLYPPKRGLFLYKLSFLGYATPGVIVAMAITVMFGFLDETLSYRVFSGGFFALIAAYAVRYFAASVGSVESGFERVDKNIDDTVKIFAQSFIFRFFSVYPPLTARYIITAFLIVYIDIAKELPATLVLRPFNFDTLSVKIYGFASSENVISTAPYAVLLLAGTLSAALAIEFLKPKKGI